MAYWKVLVCFFDGYFGVDVRGIHNVDPVFADVSY